MELGVRHFIRMYRDGTLQDDVTYRAYDLESVASNAKASKALKFLGYPGRDIIMPLDRFRADYGLATREQAVIVLSMWRTWRRMQQGYRQKVSLREIQHDRD